MSESLRENHMPTARLEARFSAGGLATESGGLATRQSTHLTHCYASAPLKIAKTFRGERGLELCLMDASPGLLAGDFYDLSWHLDDGAAVAITTQGFTRVHPSRERPCRLRQQFFVGPQALLEYLPEPLMLYADAALRSECAVHIARGGTALFSEILCAGRTGHNEAFQFHRYQSRFTVTYDGAPLFFNNISLQPGRYKPQRIGAWDRFTHQGTFYLFGEAANSALRDKWRAALEESANNDALYYGVSLLQHHGLAAQLMGRRAHDLQQAFALLAQACFA